MADSKVARRYAKSLLGLAQERKIADKVYEDMQLITATCDSSRDLFTLLRNPIVNTDKKDAIIKAIFGARIDALSLTFINIITRKGREFYLYDIAAEFIQLYKNSKGILTVHVTTATKIDAALRDQILAKVNLNKDQSIEIVEKLDPSLIGGFILRVGDKQFDTSVSKKLKQLKNEFDDNLYVKEY